MNPARNLEVAADFLDSGADYRDRLTSAVFCHSPYTCGPETLQKAKDLTRARGVPFFLHLAETREEVADLTAPHRPVPGRLPRPSGRPG